MDKFTLVSAGRCQLHVPAWASGPKGGGRNSPLENPMVVSNGTCVGSSYRNRNLASFGCWWGSSGAGYHKLPLPCHLFSKASYFLGFSGLLQVFWQNCQGSNTTSQVIDFLPIWVFAKVYAIFNHHNFWSDSNPCTDAWQGDRVILQLSSLKNKYATHTYC